MAPILPLPLREKIFTLSQKGKSTIEIFDLVYEETIKYTASQEQLSRCIISITSRKDRPAIFGPGRKQSRIIPGIKKFNNTKHQHIIKQLSETMQEKEFESSCKPIVLDVLRNYEGFKDIEDVNSVDEFQNPPFDFFGFKDGKPYMVEFKGSLNNFNGMGETQKRRIKDLLDNIPGLNIALLQIKLRAGEYRMLYNEELNHLFDGRKRSVEPIEKWLNERMKK